MQLFFVILYICWQISDLLYGLLDRCLWYNIINEMVNIWFYEVLRFQRKN